MWEAVGRVIRILEEGGDEHEKNGQLVSKEVIA